MKFVVMLLSRILLQRETDEAFENIKVRVGPRTLSRLFLDPKHYYAPSTGSSEPGGHVSDQRA